MRRWTGWVSFAVGVIGLVGLTPAASRAQFSGDNVVVVSIGDPTTAYPGSANSVQVRVLEVNAATGALTGQAVNVTTAAGGNFSASSSATTYGHVNRSADQSALTVMGYNTAVGSGNPASSSGRVVARIDAAGGVTKQYLTDTTYAGDAPRAAVSQNGTAVWMAGAATAGANSGVRYTATAADAGSTQVASGSYRQVQIAGGRLFGNTNSVLNHFGGVPTGATTPTAITLPGASTNLQGFAFLDRNAAADWDGTGLDTLYIADGESVRKYSWGGSSWVARGTYIPISGQNLFGLTTRVTATEVEVYVTTANATAGTNSRLAKFLDTADFDATIGATSNAWVLSAEANTVLRGVAFAPAAPVPEPATVLGVAAAGLALATGVRRRLSRSSRSS